MNRRILMWSSIVMLLSLVIFLVFFYSLFLNLFFGNSPNIISLKIENKTETEIDSFTITHTDIKSDIKLPVVKANGTLEYDIDIRETSSDDFNRGSMQIEFKGNSETIVGYFGRGSGGKVKIFINSIDENDNIDFYIDSDVIQ